MRAIRLSALTVGFAGLLALAGCQSAQSPAADLDLGPQLDTDGQRRSVVLDTSLQQYIASRQAPPDSLPWYADRNDLTPAATWGYRLPTVQSSVTITRDRQYNSHGRVRDQFDSTTYRREYREAIR